VLPSAEEKRFSAVQRHYGPDFTTSELAAHQVPHAHQVVGPQANVKIQSTFNVPAMPNFAHNGRSQPAKNFFDALLFSSDAGIARVRVVRLSMGAAASSSQVLRHVRCHPQVPALAHKNPQVSKPLSPHRHRPLPGSSCSISARIALAVPVASHTRLSTIKPFAILHQQISAVAQLGLLARAFARHLRFWIAFRFVRSFERFSPR